MTETERAAYWAAQSDDHRPVLDPAVILRDELWQLGWE